MTDEEKEAKEMLEKFISEHKLFNIRQADNLEGNIETILNLIDKQQCKIKLLEKENEELKFKISAKEKVHEYDLEMIDKVKGENVELQKEIEKLKRYEKYYQNEKVVFSKKDYISKDKIRNKIKELRIDYHMYMGAIMELQELLGDENEN